MHEPGPVPPKDESPEQGAVADTIAENDAFSDQHDVTSAEQPPAKQPKRPRRQTDPVVRWLTLGIVGVVILWAVSMLSAMLFGLFTPPVAPRTAAERDLMVLTATVESGKAKTQTYAQYVATLINAGQLSKAQEALDQALKTTKVDKSYLYARQADLLLAQKDYQGTVEAADKAMAEAEKELKAFMDENVRNNRKRTAAAQMPSSYKESALAKAIALVASNDHANAITAFDTYLKQSPTDSDILVQRGLSKVAVNDNDGAAKDFRTALKYIPDYEPALNGLKQIGAQK